MEEILGFIWITLVALLLVAFLVVHWLRRIYYALSLIASRQPYQGGRVERFQRN